MVGKETNMTDSEQVKVLRETCRTYLTKSGLKFLVDMDQDFVLMFNEGVQVFVMPRDFGEGRTVVLVKAPVVTGVNIDGDLGLFLSEENAKMLFGKLCLYRERKEVHFEQALLGDFLNQAELEVAVGIVAGSTDKYDDAIKSKWGGKKFGET
jgi:hypothetical protein